jgi:hypothetical protein
MFQAWVSYPGYIIITAIIFLGQKKLADVNGDMGLSYGKAFVFGLLVALFSAVIVSVYNYLFFTVIAPDSIQQTLDFAEQKMLEKGLAEDQVDMALQMQKKLMTPVYMTLFGFGGSIIIGALLSLITSIFSKKAETV